MVFAHSIPTLFFYYKGANDNKNYLPLTQDEFSVTLNPKYISGKH